MKKAVMSNSKDCSHNSSKFCICGGHSAHDIKKNRNHNSTKSKLQHRRERRAILLYNI